jgi:NAD(P)-dependent dehydrogenase (short-subunit alcohol dehydrogenase family)
MLITGASRGIGAATAKLAAARGYAVAVNYSASADRAEQVVAEITTAGGTAIAIGADVAEEQAVLAMFARVDHELGTLDVLVNNAGTATQYGAFADLQIEPMRRMVEVNVIGAFICAREATRRMSTKLGGKGGVIVNISSRAAEIGGANEWIDYAATKGAIDSLTSGLGKELALQGVRVCGIHPGLIDNDFNNHATAGRLDRIVANVPMQRAGTSDEVAEAILWLASDAASYVTGSNLHVSGGR